MKKEKKLDSEFLKELDIKKEEKEQEDKISFLLNSFVTNRKEIRIVSEDTMIFLDKVRNDVDLRLWEIVPNIVLLIFESIKIELSLKPDMFEPIKFGCLFTIGIDKATFSNSSGKMGSINPYILTADSINKNNIPVGDGFKYKDRITESGDPIYLEMMKISDKIDETIEIEGDGFVSDLLPNTFSNKDIIFRIVDRARRKLSEDYGININRWVVLLLTFDAFFFQLKKFLIQNKDFSAIGMEIEMARMVNLGIQRTVDEKDKVKYNLYIGPNQKLKLKVKDDSKTEIKKEGNKRRGD